MRQFFTWWAGFLIGSLLFQAMNTGGHLTGSSVWQAVVTGLLSAAILAAYSRWRARRGGSQSTGS